jgi:outer membrane protein assembly factor BamB
VPAPVTPAPHTPGPVAPAAPAPAYEVAWTQPVGSAATALDVSLDVLVTPAGVVTAGTNTPMTLRAADSGDERWTTTITTWRATTGSADAVFGLSGAALHAVDLASGRVRWSAPADASPAHLALDDDHVVVADAVAVTAYAVADGQIVWRVNPGAPVVTTPVRDAALVLVGLDNGDIVALDRSTGAIVWRSPYGRVTEALAVGAGRVFANVEGGIVCAVRASDGARSWCYDFHIPIVGAPMVDAHLVYLAVFDNTVRALDPGNGALRRQDRLGARPGAGPIQAGALVMTPLTTGELAVFDASGKALARVPAGDARTLQHLDALSVAPDANTFATVTLAPGGNQTLTYYRHAAAPPPPTMAPATPLSTVGTPLSSLAPPPPDQSHP